MTNFSRSINLSENFNFWIFIFNTFCEHMVIIDGKELEEVSQEDMARPPYRYIGRFRSNKESQKNFLGTGFLISPNLVLTAANCIYIEKRE